MNEQIYCVEYLSGHTSPGGHVSPPPNPNVLAGVEEENNGSVPNVKSCEKELAV